MIVKVIEVQKRDPSRHWYRAPIESHRILVKNSSLSPDTRVALRGKVAHEVEVISGFPGTHTSLRQKIPPSTQSDTTPEVKILTITKSQFRLAIITVDYPIAAQLMASRESVTSTLNQIVKRSKITP